MEIFDEEFRKRNHKPKSVVFGILVLAFGFVLLLRNAGLMNDTFHDIIFSWEMLLIAIGVINLFDRNRTFGLILITLGAVFLIPDIVNIPVELHRIFWPCIIIIIGVYLLFGSHRHHRFHSFTQESKGEDYLDEVAVFSGIERNIVTPDFRGGKIVTVFGGAKLNLTQAVLSPGVNELEIVCLFGGTTLIVPPDWNVKIEVMHVFGGYADKRNYVQVDFSKTLVIKGVTIFGGGEVKSY
ncbi:MAG: DUF5668 domain-containing protein [Bacteroidetes bacterium]|nr:DUF5668 domain-containing protein [Bacteroidota bacterium]